MNITKRKKMNRRFREALIKENGYSMTELIAVVIILGLLASAVIPMTKMTVIRGKELELRRSLREMRRAIDLYKKMADDKKIEVDATGTGYPQEFEELIEGVQLVGTDRKMKFLRRIPKDPFTGRREWGFRGSQDDPDSESWDGEDIFDVHSLSEKKALDGTFYREW